jgi:peptidoglycan/xylan/chitin deacetylase (PgdA/CDA1 family)
MFRALGKKIYISALSLLQADRFQIARLLNSGKIVVLNFHRVSSDENAFWSPMKPSVFDEFVSWSSQHFEVRPLRDLGKQQSDKPIAVFSFDDGYRDFLEYALPVLEKHGLSANLNVIPECAESGRPIWNVRLYDFLQSASIETIKKIDLPGFEICLMENNPSAKLKYGLAISRFLKNRPRNERKELWRRIEPFLIDDSEAGTQMLSTDEIKQLPDFVELGVHSYSHESMGFESEEFFGEDLAKCKAYFADKLNIPMTIYAFPNGSYRQSQVEKLRSEGIEHILLVDEEFAKPQSDVHPRITMYGNSLNEACFRALRI